MFRVFLASACALALGACGAQTNGTPVKQTVELADPGEAHLWLEEVEGAEALDWVRAQNTRTLGVLEADPRYQTLYDDALAILNASDKIAYPNYRGGWVYNFWQDEASVRGIWRRTRLDSYRTDAPVWETLLDFDKLAADEGANWVFKGASCLSPTYEKCLISLSDGGKDASVVREFDIAKKAFVDGGFVMPEAKSGTAWIGADALLVATSWGEGSLTESGYPFIVKRWTRGAELAAAEELIRGTTTDVGVWPAAFEVAPGVFEPMAVRAVSFFETEYHWLGGETPVKLNLPLKSSPSTLFDGQLVFSIEEDWTPNEGGQTFAQGSLLSVDWDALKTGASPLPVETVYVPDARSALEGASASRSKLVVSVIENVVGKAYAFERKDGAWTSSPIPLPDNSTIGVASINNDSDIAFINVEGMLTPDSLYEVDLAAMSVAPVKSLPAWFDASGMVAEQLEASSKDGTKVPYFVVRPKDMVMDGTAPTLLYGYGGFQVTMNPTYSAVRGKLWLENGGVFVLANIRGGGEFGPAWHQAGLKTNRQVIYDDFIAVAEDLIARKITTPRHLGIQGGSNGGLLMGVMFNQRPDLWNAVICQVPLLDMMRYHLLLAGASWVGEYGNPDDPVEGAFLKTISPYHTVDVNADYPEIFFVTSTKDDRVHPGHARKMAKLLEDHGKAFYYYENIDGGHSAAANLREVAHRSALEYVYLMRKLKDAPEG
jgi:prolyl oligopeptidase